MAGHRAKPPAGRTLDRSHPLADGLLHCLPFAEGAGGRAADPATGVRAAWASGDETVPAWASGRYGKGFSAANVDSRFEVADAGNIAAGDFTVRVVYLPRSLPGAYTNLINKGGAAGEMSVYVNTSGQLQYVAFGGAANDTLFRGSMPVGAVADMVITRTGTTCQLYVNGAAAGATFSNSGTTASAGSTLKVGRVDNTRPDCVFELVQVWKGRCLSAAEVARAAADPFAVLRPRRLPVPLYAEAGGGGGGDAVPVCWGQYRRRR